MTHEKSLRNCKDIYQEQMNIINARHAKHKKKGKVMCPKQA